jgi:hypothetical protein
MGEKKEVEGGKTPSYGKYTPSYLVTPLIRAKGFYENTVFYERLTRHNKRIITLAMFNTST